MLSILSSCSHTYYGNFSEVSASLQGGMAQDATKILKAHYPPAKTQFIVQQKTNDSFGKSLVYLMRLQGYSMKEYGAKTLIQPGVPLSYIVDRPLKTHLTRITLILGNTVLSRVYTTQNSRLAPAGPWVFRGI